MAKQNEEFSSLKAQLEEKQCELTIIMEELENKKKLLSKLGCEIQDKDKVIETHELQTLKFTQQNKDAKEKSLADSKTITKLTENNNTLLSEINNFKNKLNAAECKIKEQNETQTSNSNGISYSLEITRTKKKQYKKLNKDKEELIATLQEQVNELTTAIEKMKTTHQKELDTLNSKYKTNENKQNAVQTILRTHVRDNMFVPRMSKEAEKIANEIQFIDTLPKEEIKDVESEDSSSQNEPLIDMEQIELHPTATTSNNEDKIEERRGSFTVFFNEEEEKEDEKKGHRRMQTANYAAPTSIKEETESKEDSKSRIKLPQRDTMRDHFELVIKSVMLKKKELQVLGSLNYSKLYEEVKKDNFPFYLYQEWAIQRLYSELANRKAPTKDTAPKSNPVKAGGSNINK